MTVPYIFANATGTIALSELDVNFAAVSAYSDTAGTVTTNAQPNITSVGTLTSLSVTGNITGSYFSGNGSQLTGIVSSYNNTNVVALLSTFGSNSITTTGNITSGYIFGNGSQLTGIGVNYGNANVAVYLPTYTGNLSGNNLTLTGTANISGNVNANLTGQVTGQLYGLVNSINIEDLSWDFGYIVANTYTNPIQYIFAVTTAGNIDMGTITAPEPLYINIGTIF